MQTEEKTFKDNKSAGVNRTQLENMCDPPPKKGGNKTRLDEEFHTQLA